MATLRAVILGNGEPPSLALLQQVLVGADLLLAADGGANTAVRAGRTPDYVVGDLDSVQAAVLARIEVARQVRVDADDTGTDLQKALRLALQLGVGQADLLGFTGRRLDHTLWNVSLLRPWSRHLALRLLDDYTETRLIDRHIRFAAVPGQRLSLCPVAGPARRIRTSGLRFALADEDLVPGERDGISNEVTAEVVEISVAEGELLLVIQREGAPGLVTWLAP